MNDPDSTGCVRTTETSILSIRCSKPFKISSNLGSSPIVKYNDYAHLLKTLCAVRIMNDLNRALVLRLVLTVSRT